MVKGYIYISLGDHNNLNNPKIHVVYHVTISKYTQKTFLRKVIN